MYDVSGFSHRALVEKAIAQAATIPGSGLDAHVVPNAHPLNVAQEALNDVISELGLQQGFDVSRAITHRFSVAEFAHGFDAMKPGAIGKVVLDWTTG